MITSTDKIRANKMLNRSQKQAMRMDRVLKNWSEIALEHDWPDVLAALDKARSALLDRMSTVDRALSGST